MEKEAYSQSQRTRIYMIALSVLLLHILWIQHTIYEPQIVQIVKCGIAKFSPQAGWQTTSEQTTLENTNTLVGGQLVMYNKSKLPTVGQINMQTFKL